MKKEVINQKVNNLIKEAKIMKVGNIVKVTNCSAIPEVVGEQAEIVDLQMPEFERYRVYPVWVKMLTGKCQGKVYGFHYNEVAVVEEKAKVGVIAELEEILEGASGDVGKESVFKTLVVKGGKIMKIGSVIKVVKCQAMPEIMGESAEIVDLQVQEYERYRIYPVWAKMLAGERQGKVFGFHYDEVAVVGEKAEVGVAAGLGEIRAPSPVKVGDTINIKRSDWKPGLVGEAAEIVDLQMQEYEKYRACQVWAKMLAGEFKGKVYGFNYDEIEVVAKETELLTTLEEILGSVSKAEEIAEIERITKGLLKEEGKVKVGDTVTITRCLPMPDLSGESAEVVDMQLQELERYRTYPVWLKIGSGARKGKVYGFQPDEVELLGGHEVRTAGHKIVKTKLAEDIERVIGKASTIEEIAEIEKAINEAKGRILLEPALGFWEGKTPCWEMFRCPEAVRNECPAFHYRSLPCWEIEGTYSKLHEYGVRGDCTKICENCRVYKRYGSAEPIEIKLHGRGFNQVEGQI